MPEKEETSQPSQQIKDSDTQDVLTELEDGKRRERNIIIFRIKEQTNSEGQDRKKAVEDEIKSSLSVCNLQGCKME